LNAAQVNIELAQVICQQLALINAHMHCSEAQWQQVASSVICPELAPIQLIQQFV